MAEQNVFTVIGDPTRRRIMDLLRGGGHSVGELADALGVAQPNVSKHLRMLGRASLVEARIDGPRRYYTLAPDGLRQLEAWLAPFREIWADRLDALERHLDDLE
ncbi:metalloregulator ArsR/SmtB family transcription factor [Tsukamurella sp. 8F]|uniref:ArsR/SmtB family transcription factor n=1 Tax=unclassified Tsukamurella TaxID=2633480 RepID=UPI0023B950A7|nr:MULTISPECIES: metalloregulator ArsR/SmtB family transcription factor [unclassified Tsukamurella]MDF0532594.1 metalloregulator ArsR/SmtB family transcription factor [Tsukamurella sp. 8J]MDF0589341.1 metalloregulator ArsR/SmtB family transcription factor [Tsukamurella sp. 8F]